jgi:hypothetical protein
MFWGMRRSALDRLSIIAEDQFQTEDHMADNYEFVEEDQDEEGEEEVEFEEDIDEVNE